MSGEHKIGAEFDDVTRIPFWMQHVEKFVRDLKITPKIRPPVAKDLQAMLAKAKGKKAQFVASLDGSLFAIELRVPGQKAIRAVSYDLDALHDNDKQREVLEQMAATTSLIKKAEVEKWHDTHYGKDEISFFAGTISDMKRSRDDLQPKVAALKSFAYDMPAGPLQAQLRAFTDKHSWTHYLDFADDVKKKAADKAIYDKYVSPTAQYPVNLPPALKTPIERAIQAGKPADWSAGRALIVKMIDTKFIGDFRKEALPPMEKELNRLKTEIPQKEAEFKRVGGS